MNPAITHAEITDPERNAIYADFAAINEKYGLVQDGDARRISLHIKDAESAADVETATAGTAAIIGYASGLQHGSWFTVTDLWVHAAHRRRGMATRLLHALLDEATQAGCTHAHLRTQGSKNEAFYEGFGFAEMGRLAGFGGKAGFDCVFYQMPISPAVTHPFAPIADASSRVLILGTMPSVQSRKAHFYYSHPRNRFWPMIAACCGQPTPQSSEEKTHLLLSNGIALWDVLARCEIANSNDASIRNPECNDIATLIHDKPIEKILCNGKKAYSLCRQLNLSVPIVCMPSTSPANAAWSLERLATAWKTELIK